MKKVFSFRENLKFICLFVFFGPISYFSIGQSIISLEIIPNNPTSSDEVFLASHIVMSKMYNYPGAVVDINGSDVVVNVCFFTGGFAPAQPTHYFDTINLGFFANGTYNLEFNLSSNLIDTECAESDIISSLDTTLFVDRFLSTQEVSHLPVTFYPNPSSDKLNFTLKGNANSIQLEIIDITGKQVRAHRFLSQGNGEFKNTIDVSGLTKGLYFCKFDTGGKQFTKKFIKN